MTRKIWEMPFDKVRDYLDAGGTGVVIPFGTIEPHGPHLPMGTDFLLAESMGERIAERFKWLVAPSLNYGINNTLTVYPGATTIDGETYSKYVTQIVEGYVKLGFSHVILNNGHGPNKAGLEEAAKKITNLYPDSRIMVISWWDMDKAAMKDVYEGKSTGHAGVDETAAVIYFHDNLVDRERFEEKSYWVWTDGFKTYPAPASCVLSDSSGIPDFDEKKAKAFTEKVLELIFERIDSALKGFEFNLGD
ncbi:creatininase family protein [bacterium]|nr:creatininase family protein [bacterium]MBU1025716.1 creatininase family protein [bacterium]